MFVLRSAHRLSPPGMFVTPVRSPGNKASAVMARVLLLAASGRKTTELAPLPSPCGPQNQMLALPLCSDAQLSRRFGGGAGWAHRSVANVVRYCWHACRAATSLLAAPLKSIAKNK